MHAHYNRVRANIIIIRILILTRTMEHVSDAWMPPSLDSRIHSLVPQDLTGRITNFDNQYCAAGGFGDVYRCQLHNEWGAKEV